ncbi:MAG: Asp-tRNA(Asn)/Glu-tRNA(Gln) amidotransferase subunit GatA [bacterium]
MSIKDLAAKIKNKNITPAQLVEEAYTNIQRSEDQINSFITLRPKSDVLEELAKLKPSNSPLYGIPYVLKDAYATKGIQTTTASNILKGFVPTYSATVYKKLQAAGAILIGKCNQDAWGHGGSTENTDFGVTHNPWDISRVAGGSSGGPAAAIAANFCTFAIGEDTGGSIRNPAAWTNTTGLKVTYGRVSRYGAIAYASSFDTVGPMAKTAEDLAYILSTIAGVDPYDATTSPTPIDDYLAHLGNDLAGKTIGVPKELYGDGLDSEIKAAIMSAIEKYKEMGVKIIEISLPISEIGLAAYYLIAPSETSSNLARYDGIRFGQGRGEFTQETIRRIMIGTYALSAGYYDAYYRKAQKVRTLLVRAYEQALAGCDALIMPVNPTMPPQIGELISDPLSNLLADVYTTSINPVGVPSLALPAGFSKSGLPIGMQLVGKKFSESLLLNLGYQYQQVTDWHTRSPKL